MKKDEGVELGDGTSLSRSSAGTLHHQLYVALLEMIRSGVLKPGDRMPSEAELMARYDVSRATARRALDELRRQGAVQRQQGKGTFVLHPRLNATIPYLHSVADEIEKLGYTPGVVPLSVERVPAGADVADLLRVEPGTTVLVVNRIRTADGEPIYLAEATLNIVAFPEFENANYGHDAMYSIIEQVTARPISRAAQWISAVPADNRVAQALNVNVGAPVLKLERIVYVDEEIPVATVLGHFHGELYKHYSESYPPEGR